MWPPISVLRRKLLAKEEVMFPKAVVFGWFLAFLGGVSLVLEGIIVGVTSLKAHSFVWQGYNWAWLALSAIAMIIGVACFIVGTFGSVD